MPSPQRVQWAKLRISVVVVAGLSILGVLAYLLGGSTWFERDTYLITYLADSTGLEPDADVELNGVEIGKVESVNLTNSKDPNRVNLVRMKIQERFLPYIPDDSVVATASENILGDQYIDISIGRSPNHIRAGGELRPRSASALMKNIDLEQFEAQMRTIDQIIQDVQAGKGPLGQFVNSGQMYEDVLTGVAKVERSLRASTSTQTQLGQFLYSAKMYEDIVASLRQLDDRLAELQNNPLLRDPKQYDQIHEQLNSLRQTLADLHAGKGAGGQFLASDSDYVAWNKLVHGSIESVDELNYGEGPMGQMVANAQTYESLTGMMKSLQTTVKELREDPQKFLRIKIF